MTRATKFIDGVPELAIEILSPSDTVDGVAEKVRAYLNAGVPLVWEVSPNDEAVTVHRPGMPPEFFNVTKDFTADPHLPAFRIPVAEVFEAIPGKNCFSEGLVFSVLIASL